MRGQTIDDNIGDVHISTTKCAEVLENGEEISITFRVCQVMSKDI